MFNEIVGRLPPLKSGFVRIFIGQYRQSLGSGGRAFHNNFKDIKTRRPTQEEADEHSINQSVKKDNSLYSIAFDLATAVSYANTLKFNNPDAGVMIYDYPKNIAKSLFKMPRNLGINEAVGYGCANNEYNVGWISNNVVTNFIEDMKAASYKPYPQEWNNSDSS